MKKVTRHTLAQQAAEKWKANYFHDDKWGSTISGCSGDVHKKLIALGPSPSPEDVNVVIGNDSWTRCWCDECGEDTDEIVVVGEEPDYESATAKLCAACARKAADSFK